MDAAQVVRLVRFQRQYMQCLEPRFLSWPTLDDLSRPNVQSWLATLFTNHEARAYDCEVARRLWKFMEPVLAAIHEAGDEDAEINDDLLSWIATTKQLTVPDTSDYQWISYVPPWIVPSEKSLEAEEQFIRVLERPRVLSAGGSSAHSTWAAAVHFGSLLQLPQIKSLIHGKRLLELGAGTGFLSLLTARYGGAAHVLSTDVDEHAVTRIRKARFPGDVVTVESLAWADVDVEDPRWLDFDTILATDVTYELEMITELITLLSGLLKHRASHVPGASDVKVLIVSTVRRPEALQHFMKECNDKLLRYQELMLPAAEVQDLCAEEKQLGFFHRFGNGAEYKYFLLSLER